MKVKRMTTVFLMILVITTLVLTGCGDGGSTSVGSDLPGEGITVTPAYGTIPEEYFQFKVLELGLEELGYTIGSPKMLDITTAHVAVGQGDADYYGVHWQPLQNQFYEESGGDGTMVRLGVLGEGALQGYLIDKKTADEYDITTLDQMKDPEIAKLFDSDGDGKANLAGCTPGWGCERVIEHHMDAYGLRDTVQHMQGSYFAIIADVITRHEAGEPIFYYTWTPLWVSSILQPGVNVEWLEVPYTDLPPGEEDADTFLPDGRNIGFSVNQIRVMANREFIEANPAAAKFFEMAKIPIADVNAQNLLMNEGEDSDADILRHAQEWVEANRAEFDSWIQAALEAAK